MDARDSGEAGHGVRQAVKVGQRLRLLLPGGEAVIQLQGPEADEVRERPPFQQPGGPETETKPGSCRESYGDRAGEGRRLRGAETPQKEGSLRRCPSCFSGRDDRVATGGQSGEEHLQCAVGSEESGPVGSPDRPQHVAHQGSGEGWPSREDYSQAIVPQEVPQEEASKGAGAC